MVGLTETDSFTVSQWAVVIERRAMAGFHPPHMYTMEEVLGMINDVDEPVCDGSDDEFDLEDDEFDDNSR